MLLPSDTLLAASAYTADRSPRRAPFALTATSDRGFLPGVRLLSRVRPLTVWALVPLAAVPGAARLALAAPSDDESAIAELSRAQPHSALVKEPVRRANEALARAKAMDRAGDASHARLARALAHLWARVAFDLIRASALEQKARLAEKNLDELETKTVRGRALLEETAARRGRAKEALEQLEREPPPPPPTAKPPGAKPKGGKPKAAAPERDP